VNLVEFALAWISPPPGPIRFVGAQASRESLLARGYEISDRPPLAAVVAESLPPSVGEVEEFVDDVASALVARGVFVLEGLAWDRLEGPTAEWFYAQKRLLAAAGRLEPAPGSLQEFLTSWRTAHVGQFRLAELRAALARRFEERELIMTVGLYRLLGGPASRALEQTLVETEMIRPLGFLYAGVRR